MYSEKVMDHFQHPRNMGEIENASGVGTVGNAKCGDIMRIFLDIDDNGIIRDVKFKTFGCGAAVATSSMAKMCIRDSMTILGTVLPPLIIISLVSIVYAAIRDSIYVAALLQGMRAGVAAVIFDVVVSLGWNILKQKQWLPIAIMVVAFVLTYFVKINAAFIILGTALLSLIIAWFGQKGMVKKA